MGISGWQQPLLIGGSILCATIPWCSRAFFSAESAMPPRSFAVPLTLFMLTACLGLAVSYQPTASWPMFLTLWGSGLLGLALTVTPHSPTTIATWIIGLATLIACYFISQYSYFFYPDEAGGVHNLALRTGALLPNMAFFNPYINAVALTMLGPILLAMALIKPRSLLMALSLGLMGYALFISESRGAWLSLLIVSGAWVWLIANARQRLFLLSMGLMMLLIFGVILWFTEGYIALTTTGHSRFEVYRNSLFLAKDFWLTGLGLGDVFGFIYAKDQLLIHHLYLSHTHNLYLAIVTGQGLIGLAAFGLTVTFFYAHVYQQERQAAEPLFRAAWLGVTAMLWHGFLDAPQFSGSRWSMPLLFMLMGLTLRLCTVPSPTIHLNRSLLIGLIIGGGALMGVYRHALIGASYANLGAVYQTWAELPFDDTHPAYQQSAEWAYHQAISYQPEQPSANRRLGLLALSAREFETARLYLEKAYHVEPHHQATRKGLGLAYSWLGEQDMAIAMLRQLDSQTEIKEELQNWHNWWLTQERPDLAEAAIQVRQGLD